MALRLTGKTLQSSTPAATPATPTVTSESLAFQARTAESGPLTKPIRPSLLGSPRSRI